MNIHKERCYHSRTNTVQRMDIHIPYNITTNETNYTTLLMTAFCDKQIRSIFNPMFDQIARAITSRLDAMTKLRGGLELELDDLQSYTPTKC